MAYEQDKDKLLKMFEMDSGVVGNTFMVQVFSYNNGKPKLNLSRAYAKKDGTTGYSGSGRLSIEELKFIQAHMDEIISVMEKEGV